MSRAEDGGRLSRWSRRKSESRSPKRGRAAPIAIDEKENVPATALDEIPAADENPLVTTDQTAGPEDDGLSDEEREALIAELPDIESLTKDSDYTPFMQKGVPQELMKAALRRLWLSDPIFANLDGMNEYDENFRVIDKVITLADTNYKVGKGFLTEDDEEKPEDQLADAEQADEEADPEASPEESPEDSQETPNDASAAQESESGDEEELKRRQAKSANRPSDDDELGDDDPDLG